MNRILKIALVVLCLTFVVVKGEDSVRIAVLPFENNTGNAEVDHYSKALQTMIAGDLLNELPEINLIERERLADLQKELELEQSSFFDKKTVANIGSMLGVTYILTGSYFWLNADWRIDVRLIKVETAEVRYTERKEGKADDIIAMEKSLVSAIALNMLPSISRKGQQDFHNKHSSSEDDSS